jgi:hypothetical protein
MCSYIPASPAYGVYISQLIRFARASSNHSDFLKRHSLSEKQATGPGLLFDLLKSLFSDTKILSKYIPYSVSAETIINDGFSYSENV